MDNRKPAQRQTLTMNARHTMDARDFIAAIAEPVHLLATDPPWRIGDSGKFLTAAPYPLEDPRELVRVLPPLRRKMVKGAHAYVFAPSGEWFEPVLRAFVDEGWTFERLLACDKGLRGLGGSWRNAFEPILALGNGALRDPPRTGSWPTLLRQRAGHTRTAKPPSMYRAFLEASTRPGDLAVDPFCGLNPLAAAAAMDPPRRWLACDILPPEEVAQQAVDKRRKSRTVKPRGVAA